MITEVANFKEEGLVIPEGGEGENGILKINLSLQGIEPQSSAQKARVLTTTITKLYLIFRIEWQNSHGHKR